MPVGTSTWSDLGGPGPITLLDNTCAVLARSRGVTADEILRTERLETLLGAAVVFGRGGDTYAVATSTSAHSLLDRS